MTPHPPAHFPQVSTSSYLPYMSPARLGYWGPRVKQILSAQLRRAEKLAWPNPVVIRGVRLVAERLIEIAYQAKAMDLSLEASEIAALMAVISEGKMEPAAFQSVLIQHRELLDEAWREEESIFMDLSKPMAPIMANAKTLASPLPGIVPAPFSPPPLQKMDHPGTFSYLGNQVPYDHELTSLFITDLPDLLALAETAVLSMESMGLSPAMLHETIRAVHIIRGNSGFLGLVEFRDLSLGMETLLERMHRSPQTPTSQDYQSLLDGVDTMKHLLSNLQHRVSVLMGETPPFSQPPLLDTHPLAQRLKTLAGG
ncbi:MAG: Hpt domain-containing protein [Deltaproteobacteria bacterium]|nr:Hpt domain-containing protein [Deltaproteobacteria bacterium]